jgi:xylitol oxidase
MNWSGNVTFGAAEVASPSSVDELRALVGPASTVRALGTAHSFNHLADTPGLLVSVLDLPKVVEVDSDAATVRVAAGLRYAELVGHLDEKGFALRNMGSLPHISVGGACATGTHGSGVRNGNLATSVVAMELVTADGDLVTIGPGGEDGVEGAAVHLGSLGVVVSLTLDLVPAFEVRQTVYDGLDLDVLDDHFDEVMGGAYSVSLFTDWRAPRITQVWLKERTDEPAPPMLGASWFTAPAATELRHPILGMPTDNSTQQGGVPGPWFARLPHFRADSEPSGAGDELQSEYLLPIEHAVPALRALDGVRDRIAPALQISEVRTVAADALWLSPSYRRDTVALHFTWVADVDAVLPVVALVEERLAPFEPRPHWGKIFGVPPETVAAGYERMADFTALARRYDPTGKFRNAFTDRYLATASPR